MIKIAPVRKEKRRGIGERGKGLYLHFTFSPILLPRLPAPVAQVKPQTVSFRENTAFSHDVTAAISVFQNSETVAMLVRTNPVGVGLFSNANAFFCSHKFV